MRLLHTSSRVFEEFYEADLPRYAILSHQWGKPEEEWSYERFLSEDLCSTTETFETGKPGLDKILQFCDIAKRDGLEWCWVDTCCIDKRSSAELTEAINTMYSWYSNAGMCYAYLRDIDDTSNIVSSSWFSRGWTLQELLAPPTMQFFNCRWQQIGTRIELKRQISHATGIDEDLLVGKSELEDYSVAQRMSWAACRQTSRIEDQAYCLLGLFGVNMPLLYGEGRKAFRRLQEAILNKGGDYSLFAWATQEVSFEQTVGCPSLLASSPNAFEGCGGVKKGFNSQRILFEVTPRGMMLLVHRSYDRKTLNKLLSYAEEAATGARAFNLILTIPLGCYQLVRRPELQSREVKESIYLQLFEHKGRWQRTKLVQYHDEKSMVGYRGPHILAYANDYVRIYIQHDWDVAQKQQNRLYNMRPPFSSRETFYLDLRDAFDCGVDYELQYSR